MILDRILEQKRLEVNALKNTMDIKKTMRALDRMPPAKSMSGALRRPGRVALLAEIKSHSPSRGVIREKSDPSEIAGIYAGNGADAISVLTDYVFFRGLPEHLTRVKNSVTLPVLRKDFIIDPVQIYQSRLMGADAVLLICAALNGKQLREMMTAALNTGMESLVEVHDGHELEEALDAGASLIGINNRDLKTFQTDIGITFRLCEKIKGRPAVVVSESGIKTCADMQALKKAGVSAALVGEALMATGDIAGKVRELRYGQ